MEKYYKTEFTWNIRTFYNEEEENWITAITTTNLQDAVMLYAERDFKEVLRLYEDGSEGVVENVAEIFEHISKGGEVGIYPDAHMPIDQVVAKLNGLKYDPPKANKSYFVVGTDFVKKFNEYSHTLRGLEREFEKGDGIGDILYFAARDIPTSDIIGAAIGYMEFEKISEEQYKAIAKGIRRFKKNLNQ